MKKGIIVGKMERGYTDKNGQQKFARELRVLWDAPSQQRDGECGQTVESVFVRFPISNISLHDYCGFEYEPGFNGRAEVVDIKVLGHARVTIELPEGV